MHSRTFPHYRVSTLLGVALLAYGLYAGSRFLILFVAFLTILVGAVAGVTYLFLKTSVKRRVERSQRRRHARADSIRLRYSIEVKAGVVISRNNHSFEQSFPWDQLEEVSLAGKIIEGEKLLGWVLSGAGKECFVPYFASGEPVLCGLIHALPDYREQDSFSSTGRTEEDHKRISLWRKVDSLPKQPATDDDFCW